MDAPFCSGESLRVPSAVPNTGNDWSMGRLFGTDGVRGVANRELTPDLALALGRAAGLTLAGSGGSVVVGRDTRLSGPMLESAVVAGVCSAGADVVLAGILPTPGVAFLTTELRASAGCMISASHNPVPDNGIKFFSDGGFKISQEIEEELEALLANPPTELPTGTHVGRPGLAPEAVHRYAEHLVSSIEGNLSGLRVVLDCAHGAAHSLAPMVFKEAGADVIAIHDEPDGARINVRCGSTSLADLSAMVKREGADLGFAFDGDADRVLAVDESGAEVDGDGLIALSAIRMKTQGRLRHDVVVTTVMANLGFRRALEGQGIEVVAAPVGDKHVVAEMVARDASLGGEQSGHIIFSDHATTGDGILTGLQIAAALVESATTLSSLAHIFEPYPQVLINVPVGDRESLEGSEVLWEEVARCETALGQDGRVLLRASGTEPLVRVMVEAADPETARRTAEGLAEQVRTHLS